MYLVMELCDAGGIQKLLENKKTFSEKVCNLFVSFQHLQRSSVLVTAVTSLLYFLVKLGLKIKNAIITINKLE